MSRAAAAGWTAAGEGITNMGAMLQRIAKEEMEREQRRREIEGQFGI